jgi:hypothetical protein
VFCRIDLKPIGNGCFTLKIECEIIGRLIVVPNFPTAGRSEPLKGASFRELLDHRTRIKKARLIQGYTDLVTWIDWFARKVAEYRDLGRSD